jgi:hypothetical protein
VSRAASPARSIPETIDETIQDSQSQARQQDLQDQTEIPDTFERIESSFPSPQTIVQQDPHEQEQSITVLQDSTDSGLQETAQENHVQGEVAQQEHVQEEQPRKTVPLNVQETAAAEQENTEKDIVANDATSQAATHHEATSQEGELQQVSERTSSQATTEVEDTGLTQQKATYDALQQDTTLQEANPQQAIHHEDKLPTQQETIIRAETAQQNTTQPESLQSDLAEDTLQPAQDVHQSTFVDSENQDTSRLSTSTQAPNVAPLDQLTSAIANPSAELSIDITNIVGTEDLGETPERQTGAGESDTPVQVPEAFAQPTHSPQATPHTQQARAQTPNTAASLVQDDTSCITDRRNSADISQPLIQLEQSEVSYEQNAQLVSSSTRLITQEYTTESIRLTIEVGLTSGQTSPSSRHDSSQESPERRLQSLDPSSTPIAPPPSHSLGTLSQNVPPRPLTPHVFSSSSTMANTNDTAKKIRDRINESKARARSENPFVPRSQRNPRSTLTPSAPASEASVSPMQPKKTNALPGANLALEGTRSPSTVPDHSPAPQAPTSLRTVAFANSREIVTGEARKELAQDTGPRQEHAEFVAAVAARAATSKTSAPSEESMQIDDEESSDIDDDGSVLNDDLQLESGEYIVPLFIEGRQSDMYSSYIKDNRELLESFLKDPETFEPVAKVEEVLSRMRAIETHIDLVYAEAESVSRKDIESAAQFGIENSTKFKFLHTLFMSLRDEDKHIVLVTEDDSDALYNILETFCKASLFNCSMPTKGRRASSEYRESRLLVTAFPSTASPIIQAATLIICLDGVQSATKIRQKNWAAASGRVPIIHLALPRSIGHIERYMSSTLDNRERMNTIIASLAQIRPDIGKPIDEDTPQASAAAKQIANWIMIGEVNGGSSWPLPSIGSVKAVIEFQTQRSPSSSESSVPERTKRPLVS